MIFRDQLTSYSLSIKYKEMKRTAIILVLISAGFIQSFAQGKRDKGTKDKIQSARIGLITERLKLTPEQAEKFWPLYREFINQRNTLKQEYNTAKSKLDPKTATEEEKRGLLDLGLKLKERSVGLERTYSERMLKVISAQQVIALRKAEEDFRKIIIDQIQQRQQRRQRLQKKEKVRERVNDRIQERKNN